MLSDSVRGKGAVNAILLNEFLKEHKKAEEQARINQQQQATIARLEATLKEQAGANPESERATRLGQIDAAAGLLTIDSHRPRSPVPRRVHIWMLHMQHLDVNSNFLRSL